MSGGAELAVCRDFVAGAPVDGAAFTVMSSNETRETLCSSDAVIAEVEELQFSLGESPALDAFTTRRPVLIPNLTAPRPMARWPVFVAEASELPVGGLFVFPMQLGAITLGVCDVYRREIGPLTVTDLRSVLRGIDSAVFALLSLRSGEPMDGWADDAIDNAGASWLNGDGNPQRVHQATGMLIAQLDVGAEDALARLRAHAYAAGKGVHEIAADIVARRLRLEPDSND